MEQLVRALCDQKQVGTFASSPACHNTSPEADALAPAVIVSVRHMAT